MEYLELTTFVRSLTNLHFPKLNNSYTKICLQFHTSRNKRSSSFKKRFNEKNVYFSPLGQYIQYRNLFL